MSLVVAGQEFMMLIIEKLNLCAGTLLLMIPSVIKALPA
jgi:hypothetical protein